MKPKPKTRTAPPADMLARVLALQDRASVAVMRAARAQIEAARALAELNGRRVQ